MLSLKAQIQKLPEADRIHVVRVTRSVLNQALLDLLSEETKNPIRQSIGASLLAKSIDMLQNDFPEADDSVPMQRTTRYDTE